MTDNKICVKGEAFTNISGSLYPANKNQYNGYYTYNAPFEQWVGDVSVTGANVPTGVFMNGIFAPIGTSGLAAINYEQGRAYFSSEPPANTAVTASYSVKEVNVYLTDQPDEKLLFFTKFNTKQRHQETPATGLATDAITIPAVFLKIDGGKNEPFCLGGTDRKVTTIRGVIIQKSSFDLDATAEILKNMSRLYVPLIDEDIRFGALGYTGVTYSYTGLATGTVTAPFIREAEYIKIPRISDFKDLSPSLHKGLIEFEVETYLDPRA